MRRIHTGWTRGLWSGAILLSAALTADVRGADVSIDLETFGVGNGMRPGDWIVGDEDGVVVIPFESAGTVLETAERIVAAEKEIEKAIRAGVELSDLIGAQAAIEQKRAGVFIPQLRQKGSK